MTGPELRAWRACAGLTQAEAAKCLGLPARTYQRWERGETPIAHPYLVALAAAAIIEGIPPWQAPADMADLGTPRPRGRPR